jgi:acetolactate synthase-1/2/3 large subunit
VDYRVRYLDSPPLADGVRILRISADDGELHQGIEPDTAILADGRTALEQLADAWRSGGYAGHHEWLAEAQRRHHRFYHRWDQLPGADGGAMTGAHLVRALGESITDETLFLVDGGNIGQWAHMMLCRDRYPAHWLTCGSSGVVGWGLPGAMAAQLAHPERPVLLLSGDGAIGFAISELSSATSQALPIVAVVADDQAWGIVVSGQLRAHGCTMASQLGPVDYARVAQGLGAQGIRVERPEEIAPAIREAYASRRPTLIHVPIRPGGPADA